MKINNTCIEGFKINKENRIKIEINMDDKNIFNLDKITEIAYFLYGRIIDYKPKFGEKENLFEVSLGVSEINNDLRAYFKYYRIFDDGREMLEDIIFLEFNKDRNISEDIFIRRVYYSRDGRVGLNIDLNEYLIMMNEFNEETKEKYNNVKKVIEDTFKKMKDNSVLKTFKLVEGDVIMTDRELLEEVIELNNQELIGRCKESKNHKCCVVGQPHAVVLDKYQESLAIMSDKSLKTSIKMMEHTINNDDDENKIKSAIEASLELILEKRLRENLLEGTEFNSVDEYIDSHCRTKMSTDNFGRGNVKPLPLRAIYLLLEKVKKYKEKSEENTDEELIKRCKESEFHQCSIGGQPHSVNLNEAQTNMAKKSDEDLEKFLDKLEYSYDTASTSNLRHSEKIHLIDVYNDGKLELDLRKHMLEGSKFLSVEELVNSKCRTRQSTLNFGRGSMQPFPLEVIFRIQEKMKYWKEKYGDEEFEVEENKESSVEYYIPDNIVSSKDFEKIIDESSYDVVKQPKHYMFNIDGHEVQAVDILKGTLTPEEFRGWLKGSYLTYVLRADRKNGLEDLKKANTFLNWQIQFDNGEELTLPGKNEKGE